MSSACFIAMRHKQSGTLLESTGAPRPKSLASAITIGMLTFFGAATAYSSDGGAHAPVNVAMCRGCHGLAGYRTAFPEVYSVPKLGGQQAQYLAKALQDYKAGLRPHATMRSIAATLSNEEIAALAAYYAGSGK
jgi:cytochrome c553